MNKTSALMLRKSLIVLFCVGYAADALSVDLSLTYTNKNAPSSNGQTALFNCTWTQDPGEHVYEVIFYSAEMGRENALFVLGIGSIYAKSMTHGITWDKERMLATPTDSYVQMRISDMRCGDEGHYICTAASFKKSRQYRDTKAQDVTLPEACAFKAILAFTYSGTSPATQGSNATATCHWFDKDGATATQVEFYQLLRGQAKHVLTYDIAAAVKEGAEGNNAAVKLGPLWLADRMFTVPMGLKQSSSAFTLSDLQCGDEGVYECRVKYKVYGNKGTHKLGTDQRRLLVQLSRPLINVTPEDSLLALTDGSELRFHCTARVGGNDMGKLLWRLSRQDKVMNIDEGDEIFSVNYEADECTVMGESTLTLNLTRSDSTIFASCYVINEDVAPGSSQLEACENNSLCVSSDTLNVYHPVRDSTVTLTGKTKVSFEGDTTEFSCRADGNPEPRITWSRDGMTLNGDKDGFGGSRLVMKNLSPDDTGIYTCTAENVVAGKTFSVSKDTMLAVLQARQSTDSRVNENIYIQEVKDWFAEYGIGDDFILILLFLLLLLQTIMLLFLLAKYLHGGPAAAEATDKATRGSHRQDHKSQKFIQPP